MRQRNPDDKFVLIYHGKHENEYFDATGDALYSSALALLTDLDKAGWYYKPDAEETYTKKRLTQPYTEEQLTALTMLGDDDLLKQAQRKMSSWKQAVHQHQIEVEWWENKERAIHTADGKLAWQCLEFHSDYEYERVEIRTLKGSK